MSPADIAGVLASILRNEVVVFPRPPHPDEVASFMAAAADHGVDCLLWQRLRQKSDAARALPAEIVQALAGRARHESALEAFRLREIRQMLDALRDAAIPALLLKGSGLAYTVYPEAYLRPRNDTDLLVRRKDLPLAVEALGALGYRRRNSVSREAVHTQWMFERETGSLKHVIDLHWAISNRPLFARMLTFDELAGDAVSIEALGGGLTPSPVHALLFACIHRVAHHNDSPLLMWLSDIKILAEGLAPADWDRFFALATRKHVVAVCQESFEMADRLLGFPSGPLGRARRLRRVSGSRPEPSAAYLGGVGNWWRSLALDVSGAQGVAAKLRLVAGHVFPDPDYMRKKHGATTWFALSRLYASRVARGVRRTLQPTEL